MKHECTDKSKQSKTNIYLLLFNDICMTNDMIVALFLFVYKNIYNTIKIKINILYNNSLHPRKVN